MTEHTRIVELVDRLGRITHSLQFAEGLNPAQWIALRYISRANRHSCTPSALADFMNCTKGTVSQTLKTLQDKGFVERRRRSGDRRGVRIVLTIQGYEVLKRDPLSTISEAVSPCTETERASFVRDLEHLLDIVQTRHSLAEFGPCPDCRHLMPDADDPADSSRNRCAVTGEMIGPAELSSICTHFMRER